MIKDRHKHTSRRGVAHSSSGLHGEEPTDGWMLLLLILIVVIVDVSRTTSCRCRSVKGARSVRGWSACSRCWCIECLKAVMLQGLLVCVLGKVWCWCRRILSGSRSWCCKVRSIRVVIESSWCRCRHCWGWSIIRSCTRCGRRCSISRSVPCWCARGRWIICWRP